MTILIRNQCQRHVTERERANNEDDSNDIDKSTPRHEKRKPKIE